MRSRNHGRSFAAGLMFCLAALAVAAQTAPAPLAIDWNTQDSSVKVTGPIPSGLDPQQVFPVMVEHSDVRAAIGLPPISGAYTVTAGSIEFRPRYPFEPGMAYRATFLPASITSVLRRPRAVPARTTVVSQVFPSADVLPQNLLKFYLHFSAPMSGGHIYEHIRLAQESGAPVELPFLEIDEELWNPEMTRLTLFLDPGRIKREVKPLEEAGPALEPGQKYILTLDEAWLDARGAPLEKSFHKTFAVSPPDRESPDPATWRITVPKRGSRSPLRIIFNDPMDQALALRMISIPGLSGRKSLSENERVWSFEPDQPWKPGRFQIQIQSTIEDLAGNNIGKPFEVAIEPGQNRRPPATAINLAFEIK